MSLNLTNSHESPTLRFTEVIASPGSSGKLTSMGNDSANESGVLYSCLPDDFIASHPRSFDPSISTSSNDSGYYTGQEISLQELGPLASRSETLNTEPHLSNGPREVLGPFPKVDLHPKIRTRKRRSSLSKVARYHAIAARKKGPCERCRQLKVRVRT